MGVMNEGHWDAVRAIALILEFSLFPAYAALNPSNSSISTLFIHTAHALLSFGSTFPTS
jgi:hypothetical protein